LATFCTQCGGELNSNDFFCGKCGLRTNKVKAPADINLSEVEKRTLKNLKNGKIVRKFGCLDCGYSGPAILIRTRYKWILVAGVFSLSLVSASLAPATSTAGVIACVLTLALTKKTTILCPRCENESIRTGYSINR